ncbi:MAG TPA: hypothetical protein VM142_07870 [Acidimicrobiales bacterium]|nr:hypothetical protein [Acidimicrobiales bacterium]
MAIGLASVALVAALASCSDDTNPPDGEFGKESGALSKAELQNYCSKVLDVETFAFPQIGDLPEADRPGRLIEYARELRLLVNEAAGAAPSKSEADLRTVAAALVEVVKANGDLTKRGTPAVRAATARAHAFDLANCGWKPVDTTSVDFAFQGLPETITAGIVSFELTNKGDFDHVLELYRVKDDATSGREILSSGAPTKDDLAKLADLGSAFAREGEQGHVVRKLQPGRYVAACLIPLNSNPPSTHASRGMLTEFSVTSPG